MTLSALGIFSAAGAGGAVAAGSYELISTNILTSTATSVILDVSSFASSYRHLQIRMATRTNSSAYSTENLFMRLNSDTGTNYSNHSLRTNGDANATASDSSVNSSSISVGFVTTSLGQASGNFAATVADILDAFSTTKHKTSRSLTGTTGATSNQYVALKSGSWRSTSAITSITIIPESASFIAGCRFSIYGVKGS